MKVYGENMTANESLEIITTMIREAKGNVQRNNFFFLLCNSIDSLTFFSFAVGLTGGVSSGILGRYGETKSRYDKEQ